MEMSFIFDLDDTLYCEHEYVKSGFQAVAEYLEQYNGGRAVEYYQKMIQYWKQYGRGQVFDLTCNEFSIDINILELVEVYRNHFPQIELYSDAEIVLSHLKRLNHKIGLITDGSKITQWNKIKALHLEELIDTIIVSDDLGENFWKPHEKPYIEAANRMGVNIEECCYVGDNPNKDFVTAKKLGMKTIRIKRKIGDHMNTLLADEYEADYNIDSLIELIEP